MDIKALVLVVLSYAIMIKSTFAESEPDAAFNRALPSTVAADQEHLLQVHTRLRCYGCSVDVH